MESSRGAIEMISAGILLNIIFQSTAFAAADTALEFPVAQLVTIPGSFTASGHARGASAKLSFRMGNGKDLRCSYSFQGSAFSFQFCEGFSGGDDSLWREHWACGHHSATAGDQVTATRISASMPTCPRGSSCSTPDLNVAVGRHEDACGSTGVSNVHLLGNLSCRGLPVAMRMEGANRKFDGHGFSLSAPDASIGLFVNAAGVKVAHLEVSDLANGTGIFAYNADRLELVDNELHRNQIGANVYSDRLDPSWIIVNSNDMSHNLSIALKFSGDGGHRVGTPSLFRNNFSHSGYYALWLDAKFAVLSGTMQNNIAHSRNVVYFTGGSISVVGMHLQHSGIIANQLFFGPSDNVLVADSNLSYSSPATPTQERTAVHLYRVKNASVIGVRVDGADVGVKLTTESGIRSNLTVSGSTLVRCAVAGVMLQSWDSTTLGRVWITGNRLSNNPAGYGIWTVGGTVLGAGSWISQNQL